MNSPKVSVIIPAYNAMTYLPVTIDNLVRQTFTNFEVLIVNDGSSDDIVEWFSSLSDRRLRLISQANRGISQARNLGIIEAKGEYVAFLAANDLWHPSKLQKQVFCLDRYPHISLVHSWLVLIDRVGKSTGQVLKYNLSGWVEPQLLERNQIGSPSVMIRRRCFDSVGLFDPKLRTIEDWDMWIRMSRRYQFMAIAEPLTYYRQYADRMSKNWLVAETNFHRTIEKAYAAAPAEWLHLKSRSYAYADLCLAWQVLHSKHKDKNVVIANNYRRQALQHSARVGFSGEFMRVSLAIMALCWLKSDRYNRLLLFLQQIRRWLQAIASKTRRYASILLIWMLEEEIRKHKKIKT